MSQLRRCLALVLLCATTTSCMTPPRVIASPKTYIPIRRPARIWLTQNDGERVTVERPRVLGDSLYGRTTAGEEIWVGLDDARVKFEARERDKTKTLAALGGAALVIVVFAAVASSSGQHIEQELEDSYVPLMRTKSSLFNLTLIRFAR